MLYNHKQFRKNSDKKIMRKVKKNWIVLSIASFALIGAATVINSNSNVAFASETQTSSSASSISNSTSGTDSSNSSNNSSGGTDSSKHSTNNTNSTDESISNRESNSNNDSKDSAIPVTQVTNTSKSQDYTPSNSQDLKNSVDSAKNNGVVFNESSNQKNETVKDKAVSDATDVQNYNQNKINEITQAVNNYKADLIDYQSKLDYYNDQLNKYSDEINKAKQLQNQGIIDASLLTQQLDLGDEPNAKLSVSGVGNGLILNNNSTSPIKNAGVSDSEQASRISYDGTGSYNGGQVAVASFTNLKNSYYQDITGVKHNISKIVETFSNLSSQPYAGNALLKSISSGIAAVNYTTPALTIYHNPSHGFIFGASSGVTMKTEYYDDSGNLIPLNDESNAYLVIGSLNNWSDHREGIFVSNESDAHPYQLNGSSVTKHLTSSGTAMYSDNGNPTTPDGHLWDSAGSQYSYYGSAIVKLTGSNNSVRFTRDASSFDSFPFVWATVASSLVGQSAAIPNLFKPLQPSKPVLDVDYTSVNLINGINKINYVDENNNNIGLTDSSYGDNSQGDGLTTSSNISYFEKMGYSLLSDNHGDDSKNYIGGIEQGFTVMFSHKIDTVTPDQPGEPGQPINPDNPDGPKWPNGTDKDSLSKTVNQTINYVDSNGNVIYKPTNYQVTFTRTAKVDEVTGEVTYSDWDKPDYKFSDTVSPVIKNYVINEDSQKVIVGVTVGAISSDNVNNINVVYSLRPTLDGEATKVKGEIDADNTLTSAEKAQQKNNVDSVKNMDQAKIDVSSDLNNANAAYDQGVKDIDAQHVPGKSVADQKEAAKANLDGEATKVKNDIANDDTLTKDEKAEQSAKVDADKEAGEKAIDGAKDADGINQALNDGKAKIDSDHVPGKSVADQKETAKANLDGEATKVKNDIANDDTLTKDEKAEQSAKVDADKEAGEKAIDGAKDADGINQALNDGKAKIDSDHVPGKSVADQKETAKANLDGEATKVKNDIANDDTLTKDEKAEQSAKVDADKEAGEKAIDGAKDADGINQALNDGKAKIDSDHVPGKSVADQKEAAKANLDDEATKVKNDIANDDTLTKDEKAEQSAKVDADKEAGEKAIDGAKDADGINQALNDGKAKIDSDHVPGKSVADQKETAKANLDDEATKVKNDIANDDTLTKDEKAEQSAKVDADKEAGEKAIDGAKDADGINQALNDGKAKIDSDHVPGKSVADQKETAKANLDGEATKVKNDIANDDTLTKDEKAEQSAKVDADKEAGEKAIDGAKDADGINQALNDGKAKIDSDHVPGKSVADQKETAKANLDGEATKVKNDIANDDTLTKDEKAEQSAKVDADKEAGEKAIDGAKDADGINQALNDGKAKIDSDHVPGKSVADQKETAKANLDGEATKVKNDIANDDTLTKDEKAEQSAKVDADKEAGEKAIDGAKDADGINQALNDGKAKIDSDHVPGKSVADQKEAAKANLDDEATKVKNDIANDDTLTKDEKAEQSAKVDADKEAGEKAIDGAKDADGINQALNDGKAKIDSDHVPGKSVADQKETAKANLDGEATKVKGEIDADNTLTSAEKAQQKNNVDSVKATDQAKIDAATNADDINAAYDQGVKDIDAQHVPGKSVADQKEAAKANLDGEATKVKNDIANDDTLTKDEKAEQSAKVDADKEAGEKAIDGAKDADGINQALNDGKAKIDSDHVPGKSVADQKETAKANLDGEATKVKGEIDADNTLTSAEKAQQKNNVDSVKATDQAKIDAATNADDINAAYDQGVKDIDAQHVKKRINAGKPKKKFTPRRIYMVKGFYRYSSTSFSKKNRLQGYKQHKRPNAVMFTIVGETKSKHGLKRYEVYQIVSKKEGLFRVDHKKWGYITAKPSYMRPLYYSKNVHKVRVIGKGLRVYKDIKLSKYVKSYKRGTVLKVKAVKRLGTTYRLQLSDGRYVSANKNLVRVENTPRRVYMVKGFYRYSSTSFSKKNRLQGYKQHKRPNAVMFTIVGETKSKHGLKRYEVYQIVSKKEGLFRVDHKKWGYITAKPSYMRPLYYSKNVHKVRVIGKGLRVYKDIKLSKYVKSYKRGTVLKVKAVKRLGTTYRLQLSDGRYVGANKNLVKIFKPSK